VVLICVGKLTGEEWVKLVLVLFGLFIGGNATEHVVGIFNK